LGAAQVAATGTPSQAKEAPPVKPGPGVNCRLKTAVWPAFTVTEVDPGAAGEIARAAFTVVLIAIACGELGASSVIVMNAERAPVATGESNMPMVQLAPTA
jgi:hypothetical protein